MKRVSLLIIKNDATCDCVSGNNASIRKEFTMEVHEQDRYLPIANISRIMKRSIPPTAKISKDAKECVQECVSGSLPSLRASWNCHW